MTGIALDGGSVVEKTLNQRRARMLKYAIYRLAKKDIIRKETGSVWLFVKEPTPEVRQCVQTVVRNIPGWFR